MKENGSRLLDKNKKIIVKLSMLLILIISIAISVTYAYFQFKVNDVESSTTIIVDATQLLIEYAGSNMIEASKIFPSWSEKKYFSVNINNVTNKGVNFSVNVVVEDSNFYTTATPNLGYLNYKLTKCIDENDTECTEVIQDETLLNIQSGQKLIANISETAGTKTNYYALKFIYPDTGVPQKQRGEDGLQYHFSGFVTLGSAQGEGTNLNMATVTIDLDGGTYNGNTTVSIPYGELYYLECPQKEGYRFKEWEIVSGTAEIQGKGLIANSTEVSIKAIYDTAFSVDSWETIAENIQAGKASIYNVGDKKEVAIEGFYNTSTKPTFTVRIANKKIPESCNYPGFSQTACGFVVEFVDIVEKRQMNSSDTNVGGWPATEMRKYLNGEFKDKLPSDLQSVIADTTVVSNNCVNASTDKIYLLEVAEVWKNYTSTCTRHLDYYSSRSVSSYWNNAYAKKRFNGADDWWWLRTFPSNYDNVFFSVSKYGNDINVTFAASANYGVAPAFRIG